MGIYSTEGNPYVSGNYVILHDFNLYDIYLFPMIIVHVYLMALHSKLLLLDSLPMNDSHFMFLLEGLYKPSSFLIL